MNWQPISTAPTDGTRILVWTTTRKCPELISYVEQICEGEHIDTVQAIYSYGDASEIQLIGDPTHWMPLPPAPEAA